jgi:NitT/TauT family transport system substrate-binding protein
LKRAIVALLSPALVFAAAACGSGTTSTYSPTAAGGERAGAPTAIKTSGPVTLHLAYFPNLTHAQAIVGLARRTFADSLGPTVRIDAKAFNAGGAEITALLSGDIDIGYIGPSPAINGFVRSKGADLRIIAGAVSGGAQLIVRDGGGIATAADFAKKKVADPQLGATQDVALRTWLEQNGLAAEEQGGNVKVIPADNATTLLAFQKGDIDAAWVPEPWATRLMQEGGGTLFLDEKDLWPNGQFITTNVIVRTGFLDKHPDVVLNFLRAHVETTAWIAANAEEAKTLVNKGIQDITGKPLAQKVIDAAWQNIQVTNDPLAAAALKSADSAFALGFLGASKPDLSKLFALDLLNKVLQEKNLPTVAAG